MRYATGGGFRAALEQRLATLAQQKGVPLVRLRKLVDFRSLDGPPVGRRAEPVDSEGRRGAPLPAGASVPYTKDLGLGRQDSEEAATADFFAAQSVDLGDYFTFAIERTGQLDPGVEGAAVRYHVTVQLAGRRFKDVTADVGFGDPPIAGPELVRGPDLLGFADIPPIVVPALLLELHVAEKLHAYTRAYAGGFASTRVKDLTDLVTMSSFFAFEAGRLRRALEATFAVRGTHPLTEALPLPPPHWRTAYRRMATEVGLDARMEVGYEQARAFLGPVLAGTVADDARWDPARRAW